MKSSENKFISRLSSDIVSENHHLKAEVIRIKKVLNNYQQIMVDQFLKLSQELNIDKKGFIFETPQQYLSYFVDIVNQNFTRNHHLEENLKKTEIQNSKLKQNSEITRRKYEELVDKNRKNQEIIKQLENNGVELKKKNQQLQRQSKIKQFELKRQIIQLNEDKVRIEKQANIRQLQERKVILQKTNKQMAKYRVQMDAQLHKKQKSMKQQNDKRDRQMKSLITTIQGLTQKKDNGQGKLRQRHASNAMKSLAMLACKAQDSPIINITPLSDGNNTPQNQQNTMDILKSVIKPFTQHTHLLQKISELRKDTMNLKNQIRQNNTNIISLQANLEEKTNQYELIVSKFESLKTQFEKKRDQLIQTTQQLIKSKEDKEAMQKYYDEKWNTEMNNVKYRLEKRQADKLAKLDEEYSTLKQELIQEKQNVRLETISIRQDSEKIKKWNQNLISQMAVIGLEKQMLMDSKQQVDRRLFQNQCMHAEDVLSLHNHYHHFNKSLKDKIIQQQSEIKKLNKNIKQLQKSHTLALIKVRKEVQHQTDKRFQQIHQKHKQAINEKNQIINKLSLQIQSHKLVIEDMQRDQSEKMDILRQKINKQKQKETRDIKVAHFQEVSKLNEKIIKSDQKFNDLKNKLTQKQLKFDIFQEQTDKILKSKEKMIAQCELVIKAYEAQINKLKIICNQHQAKANLKQQYIDSLAVQLNSKNLIISQKDGQIKQLTQQKDNWIEGLKSCKRQFEKGFRELKQIHDKKISFYKSRIWELQRISESGGISKKDYEKIRSLTQEKKKLQSVVLMKEAQNLIINQVKNYYQTKSKEQDSKMTTSYQLRNHKHPVFIRKPKRNIEKIKEIKTQISQDLSGFTGMQACQIKKMVAKSSGNKNRSISKFQGTQYSQFISHSRSMSRAKARVNSSLM